MEKLKNFYWYFSIISVKICSFLIMVMCTGIPFYLAYISNDYTIWKIGISFIFMVGPIWAGYVGLKSTNNPLYRNNPFTLNKKWVSTAPNGLTALEALSVKPYDTPDEKELKQFNRNKKIDQLLK